MDVTKLRDEITNDPATKNYAGMTDEQAAASLNVADIPVQRYVKHSDVMTWGAGGPRKKLADGTGNASAAIAAACLTAIDLLSDGVTEFDTDDDDNETLIDALVSAGILTSGDKTALWNMGKKNITRAQSLGIVAEGVEITTGQVQAVRN